MKKRFLALKRRAEAWNSGFNFYMTIMLTGQQQYINKYPISNNIRQILTQGLPHSSYTTILPYKTLENIGHVRSNLKPIVMLCT